jgi:hypothetical protein
MAYGDILLITVAYTSSDPSSLRKHYPVKKRYRQTTTSRSPEFPTDYALYPLPTLANPSKTYWFPYTSITPSDALYVEYVYGDEYAWNDIDWKRPALISAPNKNLLKSYDFPVSERRIYSNAAYECTQYVFNWTDTNYPESKNPYRTNIIRKWRRLDDTSVNWAQFWFHPQLKRFYPLENTDALQMLPDPDLFNSGAWSSFAGDAKEINLANFTLAKIRELVSAGYSESSATALINSNEAKAAGPEAIAKKVNIGGDRLEAKVGSVAEATVKTVSVLTSTAVSSSPVSQGAKMTQIFTQANGESDSVSFEFKYRPNNVTYTNIGAEWTEIDRVNNTPLVDFRHFKLMKVSFDFVVGDNLNLMSNCDDDLKKLRQMASRPYPVALTGLDNMFAEQLSFYKDDKAKQMVFVIADLSITSAQRSNGVGSESSLGKINRATVSITLQEIPLSGVQLIVMPKLKPDSIKPSTSTSTDTTGRKAFLDAPESKIKALGTVALLNTAP